MTSIFKNCLNLKKLSILSYSVSLVDDGHLIEWSSRGGGQLSEPSLEWCDNVSPEGLIAILINGADRLRRFVWLDDSDQPLDDQVWRLMFNRCKFLEEVRWPTEEMEDLMKMNFM